jgi:hypothetical protein
MNQAAKNSYFHLLAMGGISIFFAAFTAYNRIKIALKESQSGFLL